MDVDKHKGTRCSNNIANILHFECSTAVDCLSYKSVMLCIRNVSADAAADRPLSKEENVH